MVWANYIRERERVKERSIEHRNDEINSYVDHGRGHHDSMSYMYIGVNGAVG